MYEKYGGYCYSASSINVYYFAVNYQTRSIQIAVKSKLTYEKSIQNVNSDSYANIPRDRHLAVSVGAYKFTNVYITNDGFFLVNVGTSNRLFSVH